MSTSTILQLAIRLACDGNEWVEIAAVSPIESGLGNQSFRVQTSSIAALAGGASGLIPLQILVTQNSPYSAAAAYTILLINPAVAQDYTVNLPHSASALFPIRVFDRAYAAATHNITILPHGAETIMGGSSYIIDSNGASITLTPLNDGTGWF